jgi:hypothetical protein
MSVLVVDDEPAVRQALERALRFEGYTAELAEDGMAGLAAHAERPADAIVLDIAMPRLDGLEMCRRLRAAGDRTPGADADGQVCGHRPSGRPRRGRRRLPGQALRPGGAAGPAACPPAPHRSHCRQRGPALRRPVSRPGHA